MNRVPTGCATIDDLLGGGIESGSVTLFYGEAGTGKTNICLQTAANCIASGKKVAYLDTEGLSSERIRQIVGDGDAARSLLIFSIHGFEEQTEAIAKACKLVAGNESVAMIIVDSMTMYYRLNYDDMHSRNEFVRQTETLLNTARKYQVAVLLTSQVYTNIGLGTIEFLGGHALHHNAKTIVRLDKRPNNRRSAVVVKHRSIPEGRLAHYRITETGIEGV
ncbi:MAG: DNA repair and recombination protein RadB [Thermoplasmatales archaeon]|nr:DNA repair and recombination protein RadB [Thermoplasmatales archaeon]